MTVTAPPEVVKSYEEAGLLTFSEPARAIRAISALTGIREAWDRPASTAPMMTHALPSLSAGRALNEFEAKQVLHAIGIPSPREVLVSDATAAAAHVSGLDGKFAIKVVSADVVHKTDAGGVALDVSAPDVAQAVSAMNRSVRAAAPDANIEGFLISPMVPGGVECLVGVHNDPVFGPVIMFGIGGVTVELYQDAVARRAPVNVEQAEAMIRGIRGFALLDGFRGAPKADTRALAEAISAISLLADFNRDIVQTIEINPLRVMSAGNGVIALDAVIETRPAS